MSFKNLPDRVQLSILEFIENIELNEASELCVSGSLSLAVDLSVRVSLDFEYDELVIDTRQAQLAPEVVRAVPVDRRYDTSPGEDYLAVKWSVTNNTHYDEDKIADKVLDKFHNHIGQLAEDVVGGKSTAGYVAWADVNDIEVQEVFIENQDDVDLWNATSEEAS